jgi:hypothetical protein
MIAATLTYQCRWRGEIVEHGVIFNAGEKKFHRFEYESLHLVKERGVYLLQDYTIDCVLTAAKALGISGEDFISPWVPDRYDLEIQYGLKIEIHYCKNWQLCRKDVSEDFLRRLGVRERLAAISQ